MDDDLDFLKTGSILFASKGNNLFLFKKNSGEEFD